MSRPRSAACLVGGNTPGQVFQPLKELVRLPKADGHPQRAPGHSESFLQEAPRGRLGKQGAPEFQGGPGSPHGLNSQQGRAAGRDLVIIQLSLTIQGLGNIRQDDPRDPEISQDLLQVSDIRRGNEARQEIDRAGGFAVLGQLVHHRLHRHVEALHVGAAVAGSGDGDDLRRFRVLQFLAKLPHYHGHIVADGLGETGGGHPDEPGPILVHDVLEALFKVRARRHRWRASLPKTRRRCPWAPGND